MQFKTNEIYYNVRFIYDYTNDIKSLCSNRTDYGVFPDSQTTIPISNYNNEVSMLSRSEIINILSANTTTAPVINQVNNVVNNVVDSDEDSDVDSSVDNSVDSNVDSGEEKKQIITTDRNIAENIIYDNLTQYPITPIRLSRLTPYILVIKSLADDLFDIIKVNCDLPNLSTNEKYNYLLTVISQGREYYFNSICDPSLSLYLIDESLQYYSMLNDELNLQW